VAQNAAKLVLEPIFEADWSRAYGYRPKRSAKDAIQEVHEHLWQGYTDVVDADLSKTSTPIPHSELMQCVARRIVDGADAASDQDVALGSGGRTGRQGESANDGKSGKGTPARRSHQSFAGEPVHEPVSQTLAENGEGQQYRAIIVNYADDCAPRAQGAERAQCV